MSSISVKFQGPYFAAGQNAIGSIILHADKPLDMKCFKLDLLMNVDGDWDAGCFDTNTGTSLKGDNQMIIEVNEVYPVGVHEIPFAYPLPGNIPASSQQTIKTASATYSYNLKVEGIRSSTFSFNPKAVVPLVVADNCQLPLVPVLIKKHKKARTCCCIPKGESDMEAQLTQSNFVIGRDEGVDVVISFHNNTVFELVAISVHVQYDLFMRESNWNLICKDQADEVRGWRIASSILVPLSLQPGQSVNNLAVKCPMPTEPWRTFNHRRVQTSCQLVVTGGFVDGKISDVTLRHPITVHHLM